MNVHKAAVPIGAATAESINQALHKQGMNLRLKYVLQGKWDEVQKPELRILTMSINKSFIKIYL